LLPRNEGWVVPPPEGSYNSLSGSDIRAVLGHTPFAEMQAVGYSVTREKAPIYTMGSPDVRSFSRNKRGCAGSLIWINFDRHALLNLVRKAAGKFLANVDDIRPRFRLATQEFLSQTAIFDAAIIRDSGVPIDATIDQTSVQLSEVSGFKEEAAPCTRTRSSPSTSRSPAPTNWERRQP
jgi:hypothetical protein